MAQKLLIYIKKHWDFLMYMVFGVLTTLVNYIVFLPCMYVVGLTATVSNIIAWVAAVAFAYVTNKPFVFHSTDWSLKTVGPELSKFLSCRVASGVMETVIMMVCVDLLGWNGALWKIIANVLVIIVNYIGSKLLVFKKSN